MSAIDTAGSDCRRLSLRATIMLLLCAACVIRSGTAWGQTWEYSPYNLRLCVAVDSSPDLTQDFATQLSDELAHGLRLAGGAMWRIFPGAAESRFGPDLLTRLNLLSVEQLERLDPSLFKFRHAQFSTHYVPADGDGELLNADKLLVVVVEPLPAGYRVRIREFDVATRQASQELDDEVVQREAVSPTALSLLVRAIRPLAKVERIEGKTVTARVRAGGLIAENSAFGINSGSVMTPVVRRNKRNGQPLPNGIYAPAWSYLAVESRSNSTIIGSLHSGYGSVIPVKGGPTTERLLLGLRPHFPATQLQLRARTTPTSGERSPSPRPLAGYEIHAKVPGQETTELIGLTDFQGKIELEQADPPLKLYYIKNGGQLLARLPLVVGHEPAMTANVLDDDRRLEAEAYIRSLQSRVVDLVARREILTVRVRAKLKKREFEEAKKLVAEYRSLPTNVQLMRELEETQRRWRNATGITAKRINKVFDEGRKLLVDFLHPGAVEILAREVAEMEKQGPQPAPAPAPTTPAPAATTSTAATPTSDRT